MRFFSVVMISFIKHAKSVLGMKYFGTFIYSSKCIAVLMWNEHMEVSTIISCELNNLEKWSPEPFYLNLRILVGAALILILL